MRLRGSGVSGRPMSGRDEPVLDVGVRGGVISSSSSLFSALRRCCCSRKRCRRVNGIVFVVKKRCMTRSSTILISTLNSTLNDINISAYYGIIALFIIT